MLVNAFDETGTPCVLPDDAHGQHALVRALIAHGHRRIGFLTLATRLVAHDLRLAGYRQALGEAGIAYDPALVIDADHNGGPEEQEALREAIETMLALPVPPSVLCCGNDRIAMTVYGILRTRGIAVPGDMSVAGYDDYRVVSETLFPPLTTMELPYRRMGEEAADMMLAALRGEHAAAPGARVIVPGSLRWRASVLPLP